MTSRACEPLHTPRHQSHSASEPPAEAGGPVQKSDAFAAPVMLRNDNVGTKSSPPNRSTDQNGFGVFRRGAASMDAGGSLAWTQRGGAEGRQPLCIRLSNSFRILLLICMFTTAARAGT